MSIAVPVNLAPASASAPAPAGAAGALPRTDVLGVGISAVNMTLAVDTIASWIKERSRQYVCITGVHGVMESQNDPHLKAIHNAAGMVTPDGMPMVWLSRLAGHRHVSLWEESYASGCFASLYGVYFDHRYPQGA